jgi:hypothetical protein
MNVREIITELRSGSWRWLRKAVPDHWPDYVVKDWLYRRMDDHQSLDDQRAWVEFTLSTYPVKQWRLETKDLGYHSFESYTQSKLLNRISSTAEPTVPRDRERHQTQAALIQQRGEPNQEPIIAVQRPMMDGIELVEGWHRTIQNIQAFPNGWRSKVWIGYI